jgi:hypothetical protein
LLSAEPRFSIDDISQARRMLGYEPKREFAASIGPVIEEILAAS